MDQSSLPRARRTSGRQPALSNQDINHDIFDDEYNDVWPSRSPSSTRRYRSDVKMETGRMQGDVQTLHSSDHFNTSPGRKNPVPPRRTAVTQVTPAVVPAKRRHVDTEDMMPLHSGELALRDGEKRRFHWLVYAGLALFIMMAGWLLFSVLTNWWQVTQDDWHYGRPRTFQVDRAVGHNDSDTNPSHFIALNLNRHVQIIEFPGGDSTKAKIYVGPVLIGQGQDLAPVTLTFKDVTHDGKLDMIVNIQDSHFVFINDNGQFRPPHAGENVQP